MDNKNEKTFADLFSSVDDEVDQETNDSNSKMATFDSLVNEVFSDKNNSVSFGDISNIVEEKSDSVSSASKIDESINNLDEAKQDSLAKSEDSEDEAHIIQNDSSKVGFGLFASEVKEDLNSENMNASFLNGSKEKEEINTSIDNNLFFDNSVNDKKDNSLEEAKNELEPDNLFLGGESVNDVEVGERTEVVSDIKEEGQSNPFFNEGQESFGSPLKPDSLSFSDKYENAIINDVHSSEEVQSDVQEAVGEENPFFVEKTEVDDKKQLDSAAMERDVQASRIQETDIFGVDDNKDNYFNDNPFLSAEQSNGESINQLLIENENKKNLEEKEKVVADTVSPFFQDSNEQLDKLEESILNNSGITFDQTKKIDSKLEKIDLSGTKNFNVKLVKKKVPLVKFLMGVVSYAFFIFLVLILVTLLAYVLDIKIRAAKGDYSAPTFNAYVVLTGSMLPEIQVNDVVVTKKVDATELKVGDIITFASSDSRFAGTIITHRILKKNQDSDGNITFQTKGDNNNVADSALVQPNNIYGKVILKIPKLGYLQYFLATQGGWIIVILLPCVAVISYDVVKLAKGIKKKKNKIKVIK